MENASKALIMAAGILIGVLILTLAVVLFTNFGATSKGVYTQMEERQLTQYNAQFTVYSGRNDINVYEIISVASLALENNETYEEYTNYENEYKVQIILSGYSRTLHNSIKSPDVRNNMIENYSNAEGELTKFKCTRNNLPR